MQVEQVTGQFGGRISGVDVSQPLGSDTVGAIRQALDSYGVLFFPGQTVLTAEQQIALVAQFGEVETPPWLTKQSEHPQVLIVEFDQPKGSGADVWHTDATYMEEPPLGTFIQAHVLPEFGGDTCFSCMYSAYDALSASMQAMLEGLTAQHSRAELVAQTGSRGQYDGEGVAVKPPVSHPMVTINRTTGRKRLFVNSLYTKRVEGVSEAESDYLLAFLFDHIKSPEFQLRFSWQVGDLAFWDNHACQHYAVADYNERRRMQRVTLTGYSPQGVAGRVLHEAA
ncbi:MAG: TauD/TfdA family dioxygenase [Novosphingobium sp.]|nr:TauD/TfdA family dioxygenase [Novosphingobium sp.]